MGFRYSFELSKTGPMVYVSHLDVMRLLARSARRAGVPLALTQGFSPHPRICMKRAVKLGLAFTAEPGEMVLRSEMDPRDLGARFRRALPEGICVDNIVKIEQR